MAEVIEEWVSLLVVIYEDWNMILTPIVTDLSYSNVQNGRVKVFLVA